jgi:hypothetical protein
MSTVMSGEIDDLRSLDGAELWRALRAAATVDPTAPLDPAARAVARRCTDGGLVRLGWVRPAPWPVVEAAVAGIRSAGPSQSRAVVVLGTGGWSFAVQALVELPGAGYGTGLAVLDDLDPAATERVVGAHPRARFLAVSGSGSTRETRCLADRLSGDHPVLWLSDRARPPHTFALSPGGGPDQVALLGAPLSTGFLAPAALGRPGGAAALGEAYRGLERDHDDLGREAARRAVRAPAAGAPVISIRLPPWAGPGLRQWLLQLGRQVLGGKSPRFRPWVEVAHPSEMPDRVPDLDLATAEPDLGGLIRLMYSAGIFTAALGLRAGLRPVEHLNVEAYKALIDRADPGAAHPWAPADLPGRAAAWLRPRPDVTRLHVVHYGGPPSGRIGAGAYASATGRRVEVHSGTAWNHHSYQAVHADPAVAVLAVVGPPRPDPDPGERLLHRIAAATVAALPGRARLVSTTDTGPAGNQVGNTTNHVRGG